VADALASEMDGATVGGAVGGIIVLLFIAGIVILLILRHKKYTR